MARLLREKQQRQARNRLKGYRPLPKQREFHSLGAVRGADGCERLFMASNQSGKTSCGGFEWAIHASGRYPDWWDGAVFDRAPKLWAIGVTTLSTRDNVQRTLVGPPELEDRWGTGAIPHEALIDWDKAAGGVPNCLDNVQVAWGGGGDVQVDTAVINFKSYEMGREKLQGPTIDGAWCDEEPYDCQGSTGQEIYQEIRTRTQLGQLGIFMMLTFTPLLGLTPLVADFMGKQDVDAMA